MSLLWKPTKGEACGRCEKTVYPHQRPFFDGERVYHDTPECRPAVLSPEMPIVKRMSIARPCESCRIGTDLVVVRGGHKIPTCDDCLEALGLHAPDDEARDDDGCGDDRVADVEERVRHACELIRFAYDDSEFVREARKELRKVAPETSWIIAFYEEALAGRWSGKPHFTYDHIPILREIAEAEVRHQGEGCGTLFDHKSFDHDRGRVCHVCMRHTCKQASCYNCYREKRRGELYRHEELLRKLLAEGHLYVREIPTKTESDFIRLQNRIQ